MKKNIIRILILIVILGIFSPLSITLASKEKPNEHCNSAENPTNSPCVQPYTLLSPLPGLDNTEPFYPTDQGALGEYLNIIIKLVIGISAVLAVMMIVMGGIEYMGSELISSKESGKEKIQNALLGLLIAMGAWALLYTINPNLLNSDIEIDDAVVIINIEDSVPQTPINGKYKNGMSKDDPWTGTPTPLRPGITLNNNGLQCSRVGQEGCTSTIGLNMSQAFAVQDGCKCPIVITGGTEWWSHGGRSGSTSHQVGNSTIDIRTNNDPNTPLNKFLSGGKPLVFNQRYQTPVGSVIYEGNHWHIGP